MSCLEEDSSSVVSPDDFFYTVEQCQASVNSAYIPLKSIFTFRYLIAVEGVTDLASTNGSAQVDARLLISPASSGIGPTVWKQCYIGVRNTTCTIFGIENSPLSYDATFRQLCEAKILRAFYYYTLTCFFGDVPFYKDYVKKVGDLEKVATLPRMSAVETRKALCDELLEIAPKMQQIPTCEEKNYRCGAAMAWMLIAKMSMWNKDWQTALDALKNLETIYGDLSQYTVDDIMYRNKNTAESIFEIQHAYEKGGITYASNCASACMPYPRSADTYTYDGVDIPELGPEATAWSPLRPTSYMKNSVMPSIVQDDRRAINMASSYGEHKFSTTWMGPKFWCPGQYKTQDSNNYKIFRYADAVLMMAECHAMLGQTGKAKDYYNMVRRRAGVEESKGFADSDDAMQYIRAERARELAGEFHRKFDLVRWGIWYEQTKTLTDHSTLRSNIRPYHQYYPIPDKQCALSKGALSNPEYSASL